MERGLSDGQLGRLAALDEGAEGSILRRILRREPCDVAPEEVVEDVLADLAHAFEQRPSELVADPNHRLVDERLIDSLVVDLSHRERGFFTTSCRLRAAPFRHRGPPSR